ncbi:hypothetical protein J2853_008653 [Streptosporangium lutulentum]|uniref:Uncharacterized protein n=1 Tax=Streptosporangium lutulentum TaxID=1461250 RepID=A0ABT9QRR7_9ACTN|nr:hypothetical protein [Streptosporangium lutulentum]
MSPALGGSRQHGLAAIKQGAQVTGARVTG